MSFPRSISIPQQERNLRSLLRDQDFPSIYDSHTFLIWRKRLFKILQVNFKHLTFNLSIKYSGLCYEKTRVALPVFQIWGHL